MPNPVALCCAFALAALALGVTARAQVFITTDTTFDASNPVLDNTYIGYANYNDLYSGANPASPTVRLASKGIVAGRLQIYNSSVVNINGGRTGTPGLQAFNNSVVSVSRDSIVTYLQASDSSKINISGGSIETVEVRDSSTVNISGGSIIYGLDVSGSGTLNLFGTDLTATLVSSSFDVSQYNLSGHLSDGTLLFHENLNVQNGTGARFTLNNTVVPEPGSAALLIGLAAAGANLRRKRRACKQLIPGVNGRTHSNFPVRPPVTSTPKPCRPRTFVL